MPGLLRLMQLRLSTVAEVVLRDGSVVGLAARDAALLAWLAIEGPTERDRIGLLLWPAASQAQGRTVLRQRLFKLKRALGGPVVAGATTLHLAAGLAHDLADSQHVLADLVLGDAPDFDQWLARQRDVRAERTRDALRAQAQALEDAGDAAGALRHALALLREEPISELAHQRVIRLHYLGGDRASALAAFDACERVLRDELGARPSPATLSLLTTVERIAPSAPAVVQRVLPMAVLRPPAMVGRERERRLLALAWEVGQIATVAGEAGMGKSRLLKEFVDGRAGIVVAAARPDDAGVPFATLARLLRAAGDAGAGVPIEADMRAQLARVLPEFGEAAASQVHGQGLKLRQALADYLRRVPDLDGIIVDDLHFADAASLEMLHMLMVEDRLAGVRWAVAFRPADAGSALRTLQSALAEAARSAPIAVAPLDEASLAELIGTLDLGVGAAAVAPQLRRQTGGNPLFVLETLKQAWLEQGSGALTGARLPRPVSVERLIDQRIARLPPEAVALARLASIAGVEFSIGLAESVLGVGALSLAGALSELESAQVLKGTLFAHDLVLDAVLRSVPAAIAVHTHGQVAAWLEIHDGEPARIAQHWIDGGAPARAPRWLGLAARRAALALRIEEQLQFLERKADLELATGDRAAAFASQLEANRIGLIVDLDTTRALARCDRLDALAGSPAQALEAAVQRAGLAVVRREDRLAEPLALQSLAEARRLGDDALATTSRILLVIVLIRLQRLGDAFAQAQACIDWVEANATPVRQGELHTYLGLLHGELGHQEQALHHHRRAIELAHEVGEPHHVVTVLGNMARTLGDSGAVDEAIAAQSRALQISRLHDAPPVNVAGVLANLGFTLQRVGRYAEALALLDQAEKLASTNFVDGKVTLDSVRLTCWERLGQWARVQRLAGDPALIRSEHSPLRVRLALTGRALHRLRGEPGDGPLAQTLAWLPAESGVSYREILLLELARSLPALQAATQLEEVRVRCLALGLAGHVLATHLYAAEALSGVDSTSARQHALAALALAETRDYGYGYRAELWLLCGKAFLAAGDVAQARAVVARGREWVAKRASDDVPAEFRDSFLHRNPVNVALTALFDSLGIDRACESA
jgi:DNA-binding SARP family transcriptional activator/tetratricopeptide (TPR) repeat protein